MRYKLQVVQTVDWDTDERRTAYQIIDERGAAIDWPIQFSRTCAEQDLRDFNNMNRSQDESAFETAEIARQLGGL